MVENDGCPDGCKVGKSEGIEVGAFDGRQVGKQKGFDDGAEVG